MPKQLEKEIKKCPKLFDCLRLDKVGEEVEEEVCYGKCEHKTYLECPGYKNQI